MLGILTLVCACTTMRMTRRVNMLKTYWFNERSAINFCRMAHCVESHVQE